MKLINAPSAAELFTFFFPLESIRKRRTNQQLLSALYKMYKKVETLVKTSQNILNKNVMNRKSKKSNVRSGIISWTSENRSKPYISSGYLFKEKFIAEFESRLKGESKC